MRENDKKIDKSSAPLSRESALAGRERKRERRRPGAAGEAARSRSEHTEALWRQPGLGGSVEEVGAALRQDASKVQSAQQVQVKKTGPVPSWETCAVAGASAAVCHSAWVPRHASEKRQRAQWGAARYGVQYLDKFLVCPDSIYSE